MIEALAEEIRSCLPDCEPASVLLVGANTEKRFDSVFEGFSELRLQAVADLDGDRGRELMSRRWSLVILVESDRPELLSEAQLAHLRDCAAERVLLCSETIEFSQALALGFRRSKRHPALYVFDLFDYKSTPDWFNAKNFAHPHRFRL